VFIVSRSGTFLWHPIAFADQVSQYTLTLLSWLLIEVDYSTFIYLTYFTKVLTAV